MFRLWEAQMETVLPNMGKLESDGCHFSLSTLFMYFWEIILKSTYRAFISISYKQELGTKNQGTT